MLCASVSAWHILLGLDALNLRYARVAIEDTKGR